jgi:hypothetical protein
MNEDKVSVTIVYDNKQVFDQFRKADRNMFMVLLREEYGVR